jgi:hypothetical protein
MFANFLLRGNCPVHAVRSPDRLAMAAGVYNWPFYPSSYPGLDLGKKGPWSRLGNVRRKHVRLRASYLSNRLKIRKQSPKAAVAAPKARMKRRTI